MREIVLYRAFDPTNCNRFVPRLPRPKKKQTTFAALEMMRLALVVVAAACCYQQASGSRETARYMPLTVLGAGMKAPDGKIISRAHEPSLLFIPPSGDAPNGTLLVVSGGDPPKGSTPTGDTLVLRSSSDVGATWSELRFPFLPFSDPDTVGNFFQNQLAWDEDAKTAHLLIGNITDGAGGCDGSENLDGMLHISRYVAEKMKWTVLCYFRLVFHPGPQSRTALTA
jgi:hypothetical protein